jgi:hypothetical protein
MKQYFGKVCQSVEEIFAGYKDRLIIWKYELGTKTDSGFGGGGYRWVPPEVLDARERVVDRELKGYGF